jgi:CRISPR-associated protein Cas5d
MPHGVRLKVSGARACFTRPEMKVERVSYDVMTPSAARGILEAIHWKPAISWVIDAIHVLKPIRFHTIRRNEVGHKAPAGRRRLMNGCPMRRRTAIQRKKLGFSFR